MLNRFTLIVSALIALGLSNAVVIEASQPPNLLTVNPEIVEFPATGVGSTVTTYSSVSIYNGGTAPVTINAIDIVGPQKADYSILYNYCPISPSSLLPGQYCYLSFSFTPSAASLRLASLAIKDVGGAPQSVLLVGQGLSATETVTFSVPEITFPSVPLGFPIQNAPVGYVNINNTGTAPVTIQSVSFGGANPTDFTITYTYCYGAIPPGSSCYINLAFLPTATGIRSADLVVIDNAQDGVQSIPVTGVGTAPQTTLQFFPTAVAFAPTGSANNEGSQITIENTGSEPITINSINVTGPNASDFPLTGNYCQPLPYTLAALNQCYVDILFTPSAVGARLANLEVADTAPGSPQIIPIEGTGASPKVSLSFNPPILGFGAVDIGSYYYSYPYLENLSSGSAQITTEVQGPNATDFQASAYCSPLAPYSNCSVQVAFIPSAAGTRRGTLVATDAVTGQSQSMMLIGVGVQPGAALSGGIQVPAAAVGTTVTGSFSVYNQSSSPVTITQFTLAGPAKPDYGLLQNGCPAGLVLYQNGQCTGELSFTPSASGPRIAEIDVAVAGSSMTLDAAGFGLPPTRTIEFAPSAISFSPLPPGTSGSYAAIVTNAGTEPITMPGATITGVNAKDYAITVNECPQAPATLAPGTNCQITVEFTPSAVGTRVAYLQLSDNASGSPQSLSLVGFGSTAAPQLSVNPNELTFPSLALGSSWEESIYLSAYSGPGVTLQSLKIVGPNASDFTMTNNCVSPLTDCDVNITFTPSVSGVRTAVLQIQDNASGSPQIVPLYGMGATPTPPVSSISFFPIPLAFTNAEAVGGTTSQYFTISNTGTGNVTFTKFSISGRNAGDFGIESNSCPLSPAPLPANQNCQVTISFSPKATGVRLATISVTDNASGSPQSMGLVGEGVAAVKTLQVAPTSETFSPTPVGSTNYGGPVTITNTGTVAVTFNSFALSGANANDFSIQNYCVAYGAPVLNPGLNCQLYVNFTPSATGTRTAELTISSDAANSPAKVSLSGVGQ